MRRIGLFLGVFSVGLVLFMALTGQLSRFIREETDPFASDPWKEGDPRRNEVTIHVPDVKHGRDRFTIRGVIDSNEPLRINDTQIRKRATLRDTVLEMPLYPEGSGSEGTDGPSHFRLEATEVIYDPDLGTVTMASGIVGTSDNGARFETESIDISWDQAGDDRQFHIRGDQPIRLQYPAIEMFGEVGFSGSIDHQQGLGSVTIDPPVVVALRRDAGSGFLGLESGPTENTSDDAERIFVIGEGPLVISRDPVGSKGTARFTGGVSLFNAPSKTALHPRPAVPAEHFECETLTLTLGSEMNLVSAIATGSDRPVSATFLVGAKKDAYTLQGQTLEWISGGNATLSGPGGVSVAGEIGSVTARIARVNPVERKCFLEEEVVARIHAASLPGTPAAGDRRSQSWWRLAADRAVVEFAREESGASEAGTAKGFQLIRATSTEPGGIEVVEESENGSRLSGTEFEYSASTQILEIRGGTQRPTFTEGKSSLAANVMRLRVADEALEFIGDVGGQLYGLDAERVGESIPQAGPDDHAEVDCDRLEMSWTMVEEDGRKSRRLDRVWAKRGSSPLSFDLHSPPRQLTLRGDELEWIAKTNTARVFGPGRQVLLVRNVGEELGLQLDAKALEFDLTGSIAKATGLVEGRARRSFLVRRDLDAAEERWVNLKCHQVAAELKSLDRSLGVDPKPGVGETTEASVVRFARASAQEGDLVEIDDGAILARGQSLEWNPELGTLVVEGDGRQFLRYGEALASHTLEANSIRLEQAADQNSIRAILDGEVSGQLEQRYAADPNTGVKRESLVWDLSVAHLDAVLILDEVPKEDDAAQTTRRLELDSLVADGGVEISSASLRERGPLTFSGSRCTWDRGSQRLRVHSEEDALQSLRLGPPEKRDEIVAREIVIGRKGEAVWVFFQDVLRATFFVEDDLRAKRDDIPESFRMLSDNLLVNLVGLGSKVDQKSVTLREAISWGSVNFKGGENQIVADRAVFRAADQSVTFHGRPGQPPRVLDAGGRTPDLGDPIVVRKRRNSFSVDVQGSGAALDLDEVQGILRLLDKRERTPRK